MKFFELTFFGNSLRQWITAIFILIFLNLLLSLVKRWLVKGLETGRISVKENISGPLAEIFQRTKFLALFLVALFLASLWLDLPGKIKQVVESAAFIAVVCQIGLWGHYLIYMGLKQYMSKKVKDPTTSSGVALMSLFGRLVLWSFILLLILENAGINITTLIASLGIGGIAVGLATQNILSDLFASLSILLDRPFEVGHFIIVDNMLGTVEKIGLKTTRLRSISGELLVFGNNDLLSSRIQNYANFRERRVVFSLGLTYDTPLEKLKKVPAMVRQIIDSIEQTRFDRAHFKEFGDFSLNFEIVYYVLNPDYTLYMDIQEKINLALFEAFEKEGLAFAYPTQTIHLAGKNSESVSSTPV